MASTHLNRSLYYTNLFILIFLIIAPPDGWSQSLFFTEKDSASIDCSLALLKEAPVIVQVTPKGIGFRKKEVEGYYAPLLANLERVDHVYKSKNGLGITKGLTEFVQYNTNDIHGLKIYLDVKYIFLNSRSDESLYEDREDLSNDITLKFIDESYPPLRTGIRIKKNDELDIIARGLCNLQFRTKLDLYLFITSVDEITLPEDALDYLHHLFFGFETVRDIHRSAQLIRSAPVMVKAKVVQHTEDKSATELEITEVIKGVVADTSKAVVAWASPGDRVAVETGKEAIFLLSPIKENTLPDAATAGKNYFRLANGVQASSSIIEILHKEWEGYSRSDRYYAKGLEDLYFQEPAALYLLLQYSGYNQLSAHALDQIRLYHKRDKIYMMMHDK